MKAAAPRRQPVFVVVPPRVLLLDLAGPLEVLRRANIEQAQVRFEVRYFAARTRVASSIGLELGGLARLPAALPPEVLLLLVGNTDDVAFGDGPADAEVADDEAAIVAWLRRAVRPEHAVATVCAGALLAARAGLLDGYACTTHHSCTAELARCAPLARVLDNRLYVEDRTRVSSAGVTAGTDLLLHLVARECGAAVAATIARHLVVYLRRGGDDPQLSPWLEGRNHLHPAVHRAQDAIAADPARDWTLAAAAAAAHASERHLSRLFNRHAGMNLTDYVNRLRVALAGELLGSTRLDMERVAERSGFASARQLRRAWRRSHTTPPHLARTHVDA